MEIGAIQSRPTYTEAMWRSPYKPLTPEECEELNRNNGCYYCHKPGHKALECPLKHSRPGNVRRQ